MGGAYSQFRSAVRRFKPEWLRCDAITQTRKFLDGLFMSDYKTTIYSDVTEFSFKQGFLAGQTLLFPSGIGDISWIPDEVPGYFSSSKFPNTGNIIYDGGAWPGDYAIIASRMVGQKGKVFAFEPNPEYLSSLESTLKLNECKNVEVIPLALSNINQRINFLIHGTGSKIEHNGNNKNMRLVVTEAVSVDCFSERYSPPDIIKLDVEGEELRVIDGSKKTIQRCHPSFAIASYHLLEDGTQTCCPLEHTLKKQYDHVITTYPAHKTTFAFQN